MKIRNAVVRLFLGLLGALLLTVGLDGFGFYLVHDGRNGPEGLLSWRGGSSIFGLALFLVGFGLLFEALRPGPPRFLQGRRRLKEPASSPRN